jgi:hypothetical protein
MEQKIKELIDVLDKAVADFNESIPGIQRDIAAEVERFVKDLDTKGDAIKSSVSNLRKIAAFKDRIYSIIKRSGYEQKVSEFVKAFNQVAVIQNQYFASIAKEFKPTKLLEEIKMQSIGMAIESLTEAGLNANLIKPINDLLVRNATTGGSYAQLTQQLRDFITSGKAGEGVLERYTKQITTDSLNQYAGQYMNAVTNDLSLDWFMYTGSLIATSRPWCEACIKKKYIHRSEFPKLIEGDFPEFKAEGGVIYPKTGLPSGMIAGTNPSNLNVYRGGWNCGHQLVPVSETMVPKSVRAKING